MRICYFIYVILVFDWNLIIFFFIYCYEIFICIGYGGLSVVIEGLYCLEIECKYYENRKYKILYSLYEFGIYILNLWFVDDYLLGNIIGWIFVI